MKSLVPAEVIESKILLIRGQKVMLSNHLAKLYGVETRILMQAVRRNMDRFPDDFMFQLSWKEADSLKSQIVTLNEKGTGASKRGKHIKKLPYAFTEQGIAMLSSVLRSKKAIQVNISIMRAFVKLKRLISTNVALAHKFRELESRVDKHDTEIQAIFEAIRQMLAFKEKPKPRIGFNVKEADN